MWELPHGFFRDNDLRSLHIAAVRELTVDGRRVQAFHLQPAIGGRGRSSKAIDGANDLCMYCGFSTLWGIIQKVRIVRLKMTEAVFFWSKIRRIAVICLFDPLGLAHPGWTLPWGKLCWGKGLQSEEFAGQARPLVKAEFAGEQENIAYPLGGPTSEDPPGRKFSVD